ncbi:MAG TPA: hypothetical protein VE995_00105 [Gaiellaceae bacterium]|nr:hypothetical protein [Gaiellaceae bacterium]
MSRSTVVFHPVVCLLVLTGLLAGCGGAGHPHRRGPAALPRSLADAWASQAGAVAAALGAGDGCRARALAASLRDQVIAMEARVPARLRAPLLEGVNGLANRIACVVPTRTVTVEQGPGPKPRPPGPGGRGHGDHGHGPKEHG